MPGLPFDRAFIRSGLVVLVAVAEEVADPFERLGDLARHDPQLVRVALRDLWQRLEILVGKQSLVGVALVDRAEDRGDRLSLAAGTGRLSGRVGFGTDHGGLGLTACPQYGGLLLA